MKYINVIFLIGFAIIFSGCVHEEETAPGATITVNGVSYDMYECGTIAPGLLYAATASCTQTSEGQSGVANRRFYMYKETNTAGNRVIIKYSDIPDGAYLDSTYGIHYNCADVGGTEAGGTWAGCAGGTITYDSNTSTFTLTDLVIDLSSNTTGTDGPVHIDGPAQVTISGTVNLSGFKQYN